jgi:hypothetical protein
MDILKKGCGCAETGVCQCQAQGCGHDVDSEQIAWVTLRLNERAAKQRIEIEQEV